VEVLIGTFRAHYRERGPAVWEVIDGAVKEKISRFAERPDLVIWTHSAERDIANTADVTKQGVLDGLAEHLCYGYKVEADYMQNGDLAYIFNCFIGLGRLYVKVKFVLLGAEERMCVFSAHPNR
jgi:hypothetical protein